MEVMRDLVFKIKSSDLFKNISTLVAGTAIAQLIPILLQPVLRRFYSPEIYGAYAVYLSLVGILFILSSFRYELAIVLPKKDKEAANVLGLSQLLNLLFNILLIIIIISFKSGILKFLNIPPKYSFFIFLVPLGTFLYNLYQSLNYWLIREKGFLAISTNKFIRRGSEGTMQVLFKYIQVQIGLIVGDLIGHIANVISGFVQCRKLNLSCNYISIIKIRYVFKKYFEYPKYNLISTFMGALSYLIPAIFINKFFSSEFTGYYDLSKLVLSIPLSLIAGSIANVLLQRISEKYLTSSSIKKDLLSILAVVVSISLLEVIIIKLFAIEIFTLFFGKQWYISGEISEYLVWSYALNFVIISFNTIYISLKKIKILSIWQIFYFGSILLLILFRNFQFNEFIRVYVLIEIVCYLINFLMLLLIVLNYERKAVRD